MKTAIICAICEKARQRSASYAVKLNDYRLKETDFTPIDTENKAYPPDVIIRKVRVCRACVKRMGYKVKKGVKHGEPSGKLVPNAS